MEPASEPSHVVARTPAFQSVRGSPALAARSMFAVIHSFHSLTTPTLAQYRVSTLAVQPRDRSTRREETK